MAFVLKPVKREYSLVANKDHALIKYATAGMDENLFIQRYLVQLPSKEQLEKYIDKELIKLR